MVKNCAVSTCCNRWKVGERSVKYFSFPKCKSTASRAINELKQRQRDAWVAAVKRKNIAEIDIQHLRVCSDHFITGK